MVRATASSRLAPTLSERRVASAAVRTRGTLIAVVAFGVVARCGCGGDDAGSTSAAADESDIGAIEGVVAVEVTSARHVSGTVDYATSPPAGGDHDGAWQNCGFYTAVLEPAHVVHSLEHGAVWITYVPDADAAAIAAIEELADQYDYALASPYPDNPFPFVLTAWGRQLGLDSVDDPRVGEFLDLYLEIGPTTPEPGAPCSGAVGVPPDRPTTLAR